MKHKFLLTLLLLLTVLTALELAYSNRQSISIALHGLETVSASTENAYTTGNVTVYGDGTVSVRGKGTLTLYGIDCETRYVTLAASGENRYFTFTLLKTDDGCPEHKTKTGSHRFIPNESVSFGITSSGKLHSVTFEFSAGSLFTISSVDFNQKQPIRFNFFRLGLAFAVCAFFCAVVRFKLYLHILDTASPWNYTVAVIAVLCVLFTVFSTVKAVGFEKYPYEDSITEHDEYEQLFDAFMKGRLDLDIPFDADGYASLNNPYDYYERAEALNGTDYLWDRAYFEGKIYCYFGAAPVLLIYFPIYFVSGYAPCAGTVSLLLAVFASVAVCFVLYAATKHYKLKPPSLIYAVGAVSLCGSSLIYLLNAHPSMYYNASLSAVLFLALTLNFSYRAIDSVSLPQRCVHLALAALSAVMTVASRPTMLLYAVMVAPFYLDMFFSGSRKTSEKLTSLACFGIPLAVGAFAVMWYNYARFGSPFDFGNNYQLTFSDISQNKLELAKLFPAIYHYFLQMPSVNGLFPFFGLNSVNLEAYRGYTYIYGSVGALAFPSSVGSLGVFAVKPDKQKKFTYLSALAVALLIAFFDMCMAGVHIRYIADVAFPIAFVSTLVLFELCDMAQSHSLRTRKHVFFTAYALFSLSIMLAAALLFSNEANNMYKNLPTVFRFFENLVR